MNEKTRILCRTALLLALAVISQFFKNTSVYITGPIVNCILLIAVLSCGLASAAALAFITPITSWLITGNPVMSAMPVIPFCIMGGNFLLVLCTWLFVRKKDANLNLIFGTVAGSVAKAAFMAVTIVLLVLQLLGPASGLPEAALTAAKTTFSVTQLITSLIGSALAVLIWQVLKKALRQPQ
ncbi:MAG: ECF transporter S component [Clostridiales bacterium]|nr:ECF transporter S component [Clostridiales bacterium]